MNQFPFLRIAPKKIVEQNHISDCLGTKAVVSVYSIIAQG